MKNRSKRKKRRTNTNQPSRYTKPAITADPLHKSQFGYLSSSTYRNLIEQELHRYQSPVIKIDPATIDMEALQRSIEIAQYNNRADPHRHNKPPNYPAC